MFEKITKTKNSAAEREDSKPENGQADNLNIVKSEICDQDLIN